MPSFQGTLSGSSRSQTYSLGSAISECIYEISASTTLASLVGTVGLGTDLQILFTTGGSSPVQLLDWTFNTYNNPDYINSITPYSDTTPTQGSNSVTYGPTGAAPPGTVVTQLSAGILNIFELVGGAAIAEISCTNPSCSWTATSVNATATTVNQFAAIVVEEDQGVNVSFTISILDSGSENLYVSFAESPITAAKIELTGLNTGTQATSLNFYQDGIFYGPVTNFLPGSTWTGTGGYASPGTHTVYVEDPATSAVSNTITYTCPVAVQRSMVL